MLGLLAVGSGRLLLLTAHFDYKGTVRLQEDVRESSAQPGYVIEQMRAGDETVQGLGMHDTTDLFADTETIAAHCESWPPWCVGGFVKAQLFGEQPS